MPRPASANDAVGVFPECRSGRSETANSANVDVTSGANKGLAATTQPYAEPFFPAQDVGSAGAVENDSWNYPVCYKAGSKIKIKARTSNGAYSQALDCILASNELGYSAGMEYPVNLYVQWVGKNQMDAATANENKHIAPGTEISFVGKDGDVLPNTVGEDNVSVKYTWKYEDQDGTEKDVPGYFTSNHTVYRVIDKPHVPWDDAVLLNRPWVAAMDYAVTWANTSANITSTANAIVSKVNTGFSSNRTLKYDMAGGAPNYGFANAPDYPFHLSNLLIYIKTGDNVENARYTKIDNPGKPASIRPANTVNCSDCSCITSAFSSILGVPAYITHISGPAVLNEIKAIGPEMTWGYPDFGFPGIPKGFSYHAFMTMDSQTKVYDACLEVGTPDPTNPGTRTSGILPCGMLFAATQPASVPMPGPTSQPGGVGNGTMTITKVYQETDHNGVVPANCTAICTSVASGNATFQVNCDRNGTIDINVPDTIGALGSGTITKNSAFTNVPVKIIDFTITQGTTKFQVGDKFSFSLQYNFDEYLGSLAAPDWFETELVYPDGSKGHYHNGRSSVSIQAGFPCTVLDVE